jgi:hypothetical protein
MGKSLSEMFSPFILPPPSVHKQGRKLVVLLALLAVACGAAFAQTDTAQSLAARSSIIVRGKVLRTNASDEPLLAASSRTAVISIKQMYDGKEIAGEQKGRIATVILSKPEAIKAGQEAVFFGNPRFLGRSITIADEGEVVQAAGAAFEATLEQAAQARRNKPVLDRMATASVIFRGTVSSVQSIESATGQEADKRGAAETSEHDPEWQVATVRIVKPLRGGAAGENVTVLFAASRDIVWFQSPKLKPGQDAVFLAHTPGKEEMAQYRGSPLEALLQKQSVYLVIAPFDVLPPADEDRVRNLLAAPKETR